MKEIILDTKKNWKNYKGPKRNDQKNMAFRMHSSMTRQEMSKVKKKNYKHPPKFEKHTKSQNRTLSDLKQITFGKHPNMSRQEMSKQLKKQ